MNEPRLSLASRALGCPKAEVKVPARVYCPSEDSCIEVLDYFDLSIADQ